MGRGTGTVQRMPSPTLTKGLPRLKEHVSSTDACLKLSLPWSPGVALTPSGPLSPHGPGCTGGTCGLRKGTLSSELIEFQDLGYQLL